MLGLERGIVEIVSHNEQWHQLFDEEKARIEKAAGEHLVSVEHIGSTSVCGISAKPILDIAASVKNKAGGERCIATLENIGYIYRGENGIAGRFYFVKGAPSRRTHHLHVLLPESDEWRDHIFFRDHLRQNPAIAFKYDKLKKQLARKHKYDRDAYLEGKAEFIAGILKKQTEF